MSLKELGSFHALSVIGNIEILKYVLPKGTSVIVSSSPPVNGIFANAVRPGLEIGQILMFLVIARPEDQLSLFSGKVQLETSRSIGIAKGFDHRRFRSFQHPVKVSIIYGIVTKVVTQTV